MILVKSALVTWRTPTQWQDMLTETEQSEQDEPYWRCRFAFDKLTNYISIYVRVAGLEVSLLS